MNALVVERICSRCGEPLPVGSEFCPECDSRDLPTVARPGANCGLPVPAKGPPAVGLSCLDNRWLVVGLLLVAGPAGLPALWLSRRFSKPVKILTTVAYAALTVAVPIALVWYWCETAIRPLVDALAK